MPPAAIFSLQLVLGYVPWLFVFATILWPKLMVMDRAEAQRVIAMLHAFRFFGLVFVLPGVVGPDLPQGFATYAAYGDFATAILAMLALAAFRVRFLFWPLVLGFNTVGIADLVIDYYHGATLGLPDLSGQLGAAYAIPMVYVPLLMITHTAAFRLMLRRGRAVEHRGEAAG